MRVILVRALSVVALALTGWSLNVRWGAGSSMRGGPPMQWEKSVVGATLLVAIAAVLLWIATRPKATGPLRLGLRAAAAIAALGAGGIAFYLHRDASSAGLDNLVAGPGWTWLAIGAGLSVAAVGVALAIRSPAAAPPAGKKRAKRRPAAARR